MSQPAFGSSSIDTDALLRAAREGSREALGRLVELCRSYLLGIANQELPRDVQGKVAPSDMVQETFLEAQRDFLQFHGEHMEELLAWLRRLLLNNVANATRRYRDVSKREVSREVSLHLGDSSSAAPGALMAPGLSPDDAVAQNEEMQLLIAAIDSLPETLRQAVMLRHREHLTFAELGARMDRSEEAARKLWVRAVAALKAQLGKHDG